MMIRATPPEYQGGLDPGQLAQAGGMHALEQAVLVVGSEFVGGRACCMPACSAGERDTRRCRVRSGRAFAGSAVEGVRGRGGRGDRNQHWHARFWEHALSQAVLGCWIYERPVTCSTE